MEDRGAMGMARNIEQVLVPAGRHGPLGARGAGTRHKLFPDLGDIPQAVRCPRPAGALPSVRGLPVPAGLPTGVAAARPCSLAVSEQPAELPTRVSTGMTLVTSIYAASRVKALCSWVCRYRETITRRQDYKNQLG